MVTPYLSAERYGNTQNKDLGNFFANTIVVII